MNNKWKKRTGEGITSLVLEKDEDEESDCLTRSLK